MSNNTPSHYFEMSTAIKEEDEVILCASCGTTGGGDIKLKKCTACYLVQYCSDECQKDHRPKHEEKCKKRAAEQRDELLFKQPESNHQGDCPICCLPVPLGLEKSILYPCCSKQICKGCSLANMKREIWGKLEPKCPFCRKALPKTQDESNERLMKRTEANDPIAMRHLGMVRDREGDYSTAFEYFTRAAVLGDVQAHFELSNLYYYGRGVEKDEEKMLHHVEQAAIGGHHDARHNLGCTEGENGQCERAVKHWSIAAKLGHDRSLECLKVLYEAGHVGKDDFDAALCGHQAAIDASTSPQRKAADEFYAEYERRRI